MPEGSEDRMRANTFLVCRMSLGIMFNEHKSIYKEGEETRY